MKKVFILLSIILIIIFEIKAQEYLHTDGKQILNGQDEEIILHGMAIGNWMLHEGYLMNTKEVAATHHEFRKKLIETIGATKTDSFYNAWFNYHFTKTDVDSMKAWRFNSIRAVLHYKWFTPPIEEEPITDEITWIDKGFDMIDSLLEWCSDNEMYLILDMHGAPGGQGKDASISDYDPSKPSLWESDANKAKLIALWKKLAEKYKEEPWIGAYEMINETNWDFENSGNENGCNCNQNLPLIELYKNIIDTIRKVDQNHIVIIGGNCWGNNYNGMNSLASYDDNLIYSFHKYWNYNNQSSIQEILNLRDNLNVPIWLGEGGENSNTWFTNVIKLCEQNKIGWAFWPIKKNGTCNILSVETNEDYMNLIEYWKGNAPKPTEDDAFQALLEWAKNHKFENCTIQYDVIDAMMRQPFTPDVIPFKIFKPGEAIYVTEYDLGRNNYAYYDTDTADYHMVTQNNSDWNKGYVFRNDGVDIERCEDTQTNGYNVYWTEDGEWLQYTINTDSTAGYTLNIRHASNNNGCIMHFELDGVPITKKITLSATGGWQLWDTYEIPDIIIPEGTHKLKLIFDQGGSNLNYFKFDNPVAVSNINFKSVYAKTSQDGKTVFLVLNKDITSNSSNILFSDFEIMNDNSAININSFSVAYELKCILKIVLQTPLYYGTSTTISYDGSSVLSNEQQLVSFSNFNVDHKMPVRYTVLDRIQAENFYSNNGFELEDCQDTGGGKNTGYADPGDYLNYLVYVNENNIYPINFRVATTVTNAKLIIQHDNYGTFISVDTIRFNSTGGWQDWQTQSAWVNLPEGRYTLRLLVLQGAHNLNWFEIDKSSGTIIPYYKTKAKIYPNPAKNYFTLSVEKINPEPQVVYLYNLQGKLLYHQEIHKDKLIVNTEHLNNGLYPVIILSSNGITFSDTISIQK